MWTFYCLKTQQKSSTMVFYLKTNSSVIPLLHFAPDQKEQFTCCRQTAALLLLFVPHYQLAPSTFLDLFTASLHPLLHPFRLHSLLNSITILQNLTHKEVPVVRDFTDACRETHRGIQSVHKFNIYSRRTCQFSSCNNKIQPLCL